MTESVLFGVGLAFAAVVQPGPLQAFLVSRVATLGWRRTLPACLAPVVSDGPIALAALVVVGQMSHGAQRVLQASGGLFLVYLGWATLVRWRRGDDGGDDASSPRTLFEAVVVNLLNPNPYLAWALVLGPAVHAAWDRSVAEAIGLVTGFYGTFVSGLAAFIALVGTTRYLGTRAQRALVVLSAVLLLLLGVYLLIDAGLHGAWLRT
jgi:threonine/homoserine/homoserine lactone efflux protein